MATYKRIIIILCLFIFIGCSNNNVNNTVKTIGIENKYRTEIIVHYSTYNVQKYIYYTDNITDVCSFNGTNYLIEKEREEELLSTTAPIQIIKQSKFDKYGIETECEQKYYKGSN